MSIQQIDSSSVPYQILDPEGNLVGEMPSLSAERLLSLYRFMQLGRVFSNKIIALQRQGRATTFGSLVGQEATAVGLAAPLQPRSNSDSSLFISWFHSAKLAHRDPLLANSDRHRYANVTCCWPGNGCQDCW